MLIHDMNNGDRFEGYYILQNIAHRTTAAGKPFLTLNLVDRSGSVTARCGTTRGPSARAMWVRWLGSRVWPPSTGGRPR